MPVLKTNSAHGFSEFSGKFQEVEISKRMEENILYYYITGIAQQGHTAYEGRIGLDDL